MAKASVDAERDTVLREMEEVSSVPYEVVMDNLHEAAFGANTPMGRTILGTKQAIMSIQAAENSAK